MAGHARVCGLFEDEKNTFVSFLIREQPESKKWTPQQIIYLRALFYTTEMLAVGQGAGDPAHAQTARS